MMNHFSEITATNILDKLIKKNLELNNDKIYFFDVSANAVPIFKNYYKV